MKSLSKYRSEKACYYSVFSLTETYTFQTRSYDNIEIYNVMEVWRVNQLYSEYKA